jgi:hypothetical protein
MTILDDDGSNTDSVLWACLLSLFGTGHEPVFVKLVVAEAPYFFAKTRADYQKSQSGYSPGLAILRC